MSHSLKEPLYKIVAHDSRMSKKVGNAIGWDYMEEEADKNTKNPGRAVGKAAAYALGSYLGGAMAGGSGSGAAGAGEAAGGAGAAATEAAAGGAAAAGGYASTDAAIMALSQPLGQEMMTQAGGGLLSGLSGGNAATTKLAMQMGSGLLQPRPQQPMPQGRPAPQQDPGPIQMPYQQQPGSNSLNMPPSGMSYEEWMRRKQMGLI